MTALTGRDRVAAAARELGLSVEIAQRGPASSLQEAAANLGVHPAEIIKSLVVKHRDGSYLFALVPGDRQISWPKLRALIGVNKLSLPDADAAYDATGYRRGTITPLGSTTAWPVYADERILGRRISLGAGEAHTTLFVDADALTNALDATIADITEQA